MCQGLHSSLPGRFVSYPKVKSVNTVPGLLSNIRMTNTLLSSIYKYGKIFVAQTQKPSVIKICCYNLKLCGPRKQTLLSNVMCLGGGREATWVEHLSVFFSYSCILALFTNVRQGRKCSRITKTIIYFANIRDEIIFTSI